MDLLADGIEDVYGGIPAFDGFYKEGQRTAKWVGYALDGRHLPATVPPLDNGADFPIFPNGKITGMPPIIGPKAHIGYQIDLPVRKSPQWVEHQFEYLFPVLQGSGLGVLLIMPQGADKALGNRIRGAKEIGRYIWKVFFLAVFEGQFILIEFYFQLVAQYVSANTDSM